MAPSRSTHHWLVVVLQEELVAAPAKLPLKDSLDFRGSHNTTGMCA